MYFISVLLASAADRGEEVWYPPTAAFTMFIPTTLPAELPSNSPEIPVLAGIYVVVAIYCYSLIIIKRNTHTQKKTTLF